MLGINNPTAVNRQEGLSEAQKSRLRNTVGIVDSVSADPVTSTPNRTPQNLTRVRQLGGFNPATRGMFNPLRGDTVFTSDELDVITDSYEKDGNFTEDLVQTADQLGMTPLALLQQQRLAYGQAPVTYRRSVSRGSSNVFTYCGRGNTDVDEARFTRSWCRLAFWQHPSRISLERST